MREDIAIKKIGDVCEVIPGQSPKSKFYNDEGEGLPFYQGKKRFTEKFLDAPVKWTTNITKEAVDGDILMSVRAPVGPVNFATQKICIGRGLAAIRPKEKLDRDYLFYFFLKNEADLESTSGAVFDSINSKQIRDIKIPILQLPEQKRIVAILDEAFEAIDQANANIERNIENAEELFQSKLNVIFTQRGEGWEEATLGEMCSVLNGYAFKSKEAIDSSNTQLLRMGNLYQNELDLERRPVFYPDSYAEEYEKYVLNEGDLIMSLTGTVDKRDYGYTVELPETDVTLLLNQRIMKIIIDKSDLINKSFLKGYLLSPFFLDKLYETASGTRQANLSSRKIMKLPFYYPSDIETQKNIVDVIQSLKEVTNSIILNNKKRRNNIEELKKSILQKAFSGELTANKQVAA